jgi:hypothetical protein
VSVHAKSDCRREVASFVMTAGDNASASEMRIEKGEGLSSVAGVDGSGRAA